MDIYTIEYYLSIKKDETLPLATTWMNLEGIMLSEISWTEKDKCFHSYVESMKQNKYNKTETKSQIQRTSQ